MPGLSPSEEEVEVLLRFFQDKRLATEHADWALAQAEKAETIAFWRVVINKLKML